jgi:hypothetical protein
VYGIATIGVYTICFPLEWTTTARYTGSAIWHALQNPGPHTSKCMLRFLNENASAIQAIATVASVVATVVLVAITARYVALTRGLAEAAKAQLIFQREAVESRKRQLVNLVRLLGILLQRIPEDQDGVGRMRYTATWDNDDIAELHRLASELGEEPGKRAAVLVASLRLIKDRIVEVKATPLGRSILFNLDGWASELRLAKEQIAGLWAELGRSDQLY